MSRTTQYTRNTTARTAGPNASMTSGGGGPTSRLSTRMVGTRESCKQRRQSESRKHRHCGDEADGERLQVRGRQLRRLSRPRIARSSHSCARKPSAEPMMVAAMRNDQQLQDAHAQRERARGAERFQQRHGIEMSLHVPPGRHRNGDSAQQNADEARKAQEPPGAIDGVLDLRARLRDVENALAALLVRDEPGLELIDARAIAREQRAHGSRDCRAESARVAGRSARFMMRLGASSANEPPWSGREMSTRVTRNVAAPMEICEPTCASMRDEQLRIRPHLARPGDARSRCARARRAHPR